MAGTFQALQNAYDVKRGPELALAEKILDSGGEGGFLLFAGGYTTHKGGYDYEPMVFYYAHRRGWVLTPEDYSPEAIQRYYSQGTRMLVSRKTAELEQYPAMVSYLKTHHLVVQWDSDQCVVELLPPNPGLAVPEAGAPDLSATSTPSPSLPGLMPGRSP